jgi:trigger factor
MALSERMERTFADMKKENKKLAQEQRALERQRREQQEKTKRILKTAIPVVIVVVLLAWIIIDNINQHADDSETGTEIATETDSTISSDDVSLTEDTTESAEPTLYTGTDVAVADGDTVNIDYVGTVDGEEFSGGNTQGMGRDLTIGSGSYIDDFEEQLIGHYVGETVEVKVTFPDPYSNNEDLSGKEAVFETVINGIYQ